MRIKPYGPGSYLLQDRIIPDGENAPLPLDLIRAACPECNPREVSGILVSLTPCPAHRWGAVVLAD